MRNRALGPIIAASVVLAGCSGAGASASATPPTVATPAAPVEITVFAAASLAEAFDALAATYMAEHPGITVTLSYDSSAALRAKIQQGARVDVFASADTENPDALVAAGLSAGPTVVVAGSELAVIVPASNPAGLSDPYGLADPGVKVVGAGPSVPITGYATALLENLAASRGAQADLIASYERNIVSREDNVKGIVAKVELGEGDAGIVYATDALAAGDRVRALPIPPGTNVRVAYGAVIPADAPAPGAAAAFLAWLRGPDAQAILASHGFTAP